MYQGPAKRRAARRALLVWFALLAIGIGVRHYLPVERDSVNEVERKELVRFRRDHKLLESEIASLRTRLGLVERAAEKFPGFRPVPARVLPFVELSPRTRSAIVDVGRLDGVSVGCGVVGPGGVVGQIVEVIGDRARVRLADDPQFRVRFHFDGDQGIAAGGPEPGQLHPHLMKEFVDFEVGDVLLTVGSDRRFPRDVIIGRVSHTTHPYRGSRIELAEPTTGVGAVVVLVPRGFAPGESAGGG